METIELLQAEIQMKEHAIRKMQAQIADKEKQQSNIEIDPDDFADQFDDSLDESIPEIEIGCLTYSPSHVLKNVDPTAYRCSLNDFVDSLDVEDSDEYKALQEEIDQLQSDIEDLENQISDLEDQITEAEEEIQDLESKEV
jgi:predicted  nucleic acid-binding Zn-ribbon protein